VNGQTTPQIDKETLVEMVRQASELEQSLCVQYLYAAFTLRMAGEPGLTASEASLTQQWGQQIMRIGIQEMYHLLLASNLLTAVNAVPNMWRPNFPQPASRYSEIDLPSLLSPFSSETVSRFMCWEKPDRTGWWDTFCANCGDQARARLGLLQVAAAEPPPYRSIGQMYGIVREALLDNPDWIDPTSADRQVTSAMVPFKPRVTPITTSEQAAYYIDIIVREGEGGPDWESKSHFAYFHQILNQLQQIDGSGPGFPMAWPTVENPIYNPANQKPGTSLIDDPSVQRVGQLFNDLYLLLVLVLVRLFTPNGETPAERRSLADAAMAVMPLGIKPLAVLLTRLPAGVSYPDRYAGPSFELPQTVTPLSADRAETLPILYDAMVAITQRCRILSVSETGLGPSALGQLSVVAARLETLLPLFQLEPERAEVRP
jgi:hypothetical protein